MLFRAARRMGVRGVAVGAGLGAIGAAALGSGTVSAGSGTASSVFAWGWGQYGQLGTGEERDEARPRVVSFLEDWEVVSVESGPCATSSAVITRDGRLLTFGCGNDSRLGHGAAERYRSAPNQDIPRVVEGVEGKVVGVGVGETHMAVVTERGEVWTFGKPRDGKLGHGDAKKGFADRVEGLPRVVDVACGKMHTVAVGEDGSVWTWGGGKSGQLGTGERVREQSTPKRVEGVEGKVVGAWCGREFTLVLTEEGSVWGWGNDDKGALGTGYAKRFHLAPVRVRIPAATGKIIKVAAGDSFSFFLDEAGQVHSCGSNVNGQLAHGDRSDVGIPRKVEAVQNVTDVVAGGGHVLLVDQEGAVWGCGRGRNGQLGRGGEVESIAAYRTSPVQVVGIQQKVKKIAAGSDHSLALVERE